ncbi:hypothetical protein B0T18DRAFT_418277 [Schizothecium vesticola]|uniref:Uncharacterized protein n=1 Tax=Schizothecium vesticola TaxID=314040 RepID=A0AA40JZ70_9PEZI|nr:hypothetical protein B0T18DRAFT_418277 [Schizothecium vesticola]
MMFGSPRRSSVSLIIIQALSIFTFCSPQVGESLARERNEKGPEATEFKGVWKHGIGAKPNMIAWVCQPNPSRPGYSYGRAILDISTKGPSP